MQQAIQLSLFPTEEKRFSITEYLTQNVWDNFLLNFLEAISGVVGGSYLVYKLSAADIDLKWLPAIESK